MNKTEEVKERIIEAAASLIQQSKGDVTGISTRAIADKANVGIGLINYHFQTKDNLIELCVERIISKVISAFKPAPVPAEITAAALLKHVAKLVTDFLIENPAVSRISILSDYNNPKIMDNTIKSAIGFSGTLKKLSLSEKEQFLLAFALTSVIQALFLRKEMSKDLFGYDFLIKEQRDEALDLLVDNMLGGFNYDQKTRNDKCGD